MDVVTSLRGMLLVVPFLIWLTIIELSIALLLPLKLISGSLVFNASSVLASSVWRFIQGIFLDLNGAVITVSGDVLPKRESAVVIANHVGWCDVYMIEELAARAGMLGHTRYFSKAQLRWRKWEADKKEMDRVFRGVTQGGWKTCMPLLVSFSEGTRFTPGKYLESRKFCARNNRSQPANLLYPRTKGFVTTVQHVRKAPHVKAVYDFTIAYQKGRHFYTAPTMWETVAVPRLSMGEESGGRGFRFHIFARRYLIEQLPHDDKALAIWLEQRWIEKGQWLEEIKSKWADV
ncbi:hypothetical protein QBC35DRAFT_522472 [Podospora australis]|uniref:Phospholipid/glycerol acyltransferase domain-containing protein n=1 Tax=Podospora australis TaxID=1536484 RepID=A0AAN6WZY3_9PEZI|nr:hypothetical protein QBC35DRAFT_522472 [Podospora australis]